MSADGKGCAPLGRALIPRSVWESDAPLYMALEIYLKAPGAGGPEDWRLARYLIRCIAGCQAATPLR